MPLGKYFCDYCEKEFQDTPHLRGDAIFQAANTFEPELKGTPPAKGSCSYGDSCKYLHPNDNQQDTVLIDTNQSSTFQENQSAGGSSLPDVVVRDHTGTSWSNLPPSLMPPPEGGHPRLPFVGWG